MLTTSCDVTHRARMVRHYHQAFQTRAGTPAAATSKRRPGSLKPRSVIVIWVDTGWSSATQHRLVSKALVGPFVGCNLWPGESVTLVYSLSRRARSTCRCCHRRTPHLDQGRRAAATQCRYLFIHNDVSPLDGTFAQHYRHRVGHDDRGRRGGRRFVT